MVSSSLVWMVLVAIRRRVCSKLASEVSQVLFRLSRWENLERAEKI